MTSCTESILYKISVQYLWTEYRKQGGCFCISHKNMQLVWTVISIIFTKTVKVLFSSFILNFSYWKRFFQDLGYRCCKLSKSLLEHIQFVCVHSSDSDFNSGYGLCHNKVLKNNNKKICHSLLSVKHGLCILKLFITLL